MDSKKLIVCGDSFAVGIGCHDLIKEPVGSLVADELGKPILNLAKGSSTNFSIFLQMQYVAEHLSNDTDLVLIGNTSYDRVEWFPLDADLKYNLSNEMVNYHQYPPYMDKSYDVHGKNISLPNPMADDDRYTGTMFTENFVGVIDYWETFGKDKKPSHYYQRFDKEPRSRMETLYNYAVSIHEPRINRIYSIGVLALGHQLLKAKGVNHLIFTEDVETYSKYIDKTNLVNISWGQLSLDYPDDLPTYHTSAEGHRVAYSKVMDKLKENGWI